MHISAIYRGERDCAFDQLRYISFCYGLSRCRWGSDEPPNIFLMNTSRKKRWAATKLPATSDTINFMNILKLYIAFMSGHRVRASYVRSCSAEIGEVCDLSHLGECSGFLAYVFAFDVR